MAAEVAFFTTTFIWQGRDDQSNSFLIALTTSSGMSVAKSHARQAPLEPSIPASAPIFVLGLQLFYSV